MVRWPHVPNNLGPNMFRTFRTFRTFRKFRTQTSFRANTGAVIAVAAGPLRALSILSLCFAAEAERRTVLSAAKDRGRLGVTGEVAASTGVSPPPRPSAAPLQDRF